MRVPRGITRKKIDSHNQAWLKIQVPKDCDLIILAGNNGGGYVPYACLLPHQVYLGDLKRAFKENPQFEAIFIMPVRSADPFLIAGKNKYCLDRWKGMCK